MNTEAPASEQKNAYLGTENVGRLLLKFSVPCVTSMLVSALYNIVDQIFIGQGVGYLGNAATTVVYPFTVIALALALLIGDGSAALLSLSLGRGERKTGSRCIGNGIVLTVAVSLVLTVLGFVFEDAILTLFGVTEGCYQYARDYMTVILFGIPFYVFTSSANGQIRADGAPKYAMISTAVGAVINLIGDPLAIFVFNQGVRGAAIATIAGQIVSAIISALYFRRPRSFTLDQSSFRLNGHIVRQICQLGISSFIIQVAIVIIMTVANNSIGRYGPLSEYGADIPLSAIGIVMKVFAIVISFAVGIAVGGQPIVGFNYGARRYGRVRKTFKYIILSNIVVGLIATVLFELCPQAIVSLFGNESALYNEYACMCFRIFLCAIVFTCLSKACSIFLQSIGRPVGSTILAVARDVVFFVPGVLLLSASAGVTGMLWAAPISDVLSILLAVLLIALEFRSMRRLEAAGR